MARIEELSAYHCWPAHAHVCCRHNAQRDKGSLLAARGEGRKSEGPRQEQVAIGKDTLLIVIDSRADPA